jgi:hypothetical protein
MFGHVLKALVAIITGLLTVVGYFLTSELGTFEKSFDRMNKQLTTVSLSVNTVVTEFRAHIKEDERFEQAAGIVQADHEHRIRALELPPRLP